MENWETMFGGVQKIVRQSKSFGEGLTSTIGLVRRHLTLFDEAFWDRVDETPQWPYQTLIKWAEEGLSNFQNESWSVLLLDLGDCPENFNLYQLDGASIFSEQQLRLLVLSHSVIDFGSWLRYVAKDYATPQVVLQSRYRRELSSHHIKELQSHLLDWRRLPGDYNGDNGYLLWLAFGALALVEPLRDAENCRKFLGNCPRFYLMVGYEEIFFYAGTVTPNGLVFEIL